MGLFDRFRRTPRAAEPINAMAGSAAEFSGLSDPALLEFIREGGGVSVTVEQALCNTTVFRCVRLISAAIGMLPVHVIDQTSKEKVRDHPLFALLGREPNSWQTAYVFRELMQRRCLVRGNAYALVVRSGGRVIRLVPLDPARVTPRQRDDWTVEFEYRRKDGARRIFGPRDILHVYADSEDGVVGASRVKVAAQAIELALNSELASSRAFKNGQLVGGALTHPGHLSTEAATRLRASMEARFQGVENAHKWMVLEEGMTAAPFNSTARDGQHIETRRHQVEELGRAFDVPRPFLFVDDTSWGSGIGELGQMFVRYTLNPWFTAWEQALERVCLNDAEKGRLAIKFNAGGLIRGSLKDQAEFFAKALGSGGHAPWSDAREVREWQDLPERDIAPPPWVDKAGEEQDE